MLHKGRGSAAILPVLMQVMLLLLLAYQLQEVAAAATFKVGEAGGWTFNTATWPKGKRFAAGDTLVFNYSPAIHNVVAVDRSGYQACRTPKGAKVYKSGRDAIKLVRGQNFFICNFPGHCESGMKIAITAA